MPLRLGRSRSAQNRSSSNFRHNCPASQQAPHWRGRHSCMSDRRSWAIDVSGATPSQRSSGNSESLRGCPASSSSTSMRFAPHRSLRGIDLPQVQNVTLHDTATCDALVLDHAPIVVRLAVLLARGLSQKHDPTNLTVRNSAPGNRVGLHYSRFQPFSNNTLHPYQILTKVSEAKLGASEGRIREDGLVHDAGPIVIPFVGATNPLLRYPVILMRCALSSLPSARHNVKPRPEQSVRRRWSVFEVRDRQAQASPLCRFFRAWPQTARSGGTATRTV